MSRRLLLALVLGAPAAAAAAGKAAESPVGSCGVNAVPDCVNDMGSCGNACCAAEFASGASTSKAYSEITHYLARGGSDGLFRLVGGEGGLEVEAVRGESWTAIFQGTHTTFKVRYNDTLDFAVRSSRKGGSIIRAFSISDIAGALGDEGQNRRSLSLLGRDLGLGPMKVLFGCGEAPSLPASSAPPGAALDLEAEAPSGAAAGAQSSAWGDRLLSALAGAAVALLAMRSGAAGRAAAWGAGAVGDDCVAAPYVRTAA